MRAIFIFLSFLVTQFAYANEWHFRQIGMNEGLSFNSTLCITQDKSGFIWIGTRNGLNQYNGVENVIFKHDYLDSLSISNDHINDIYEDAFGKIWIATANGVNNYDRASGTFRRFLADGSENSLTHRYTKCIVQSKDNNIWIGTSQGLSVYNNEQQVIFRKRIKLIESNANNVISIFIDQLDRLWFCTRGGLFLYVGEDKYERVMLDPKNETGRDLFEYRDIIQDENGLYWAATEEYGIFSFNFGDQLGYVTNYNSSNSKLISNHVRKLSIVDGNELWCATLEGVSIINLVTRKVSVVEGDGLSKSSFHDILEDHEGGVWLASYTGGINYYHHQNNLFPYVAKSAPLKLGSSDKSVTGFLNDKNGVWISTGDGGLIFNNENNDIFEYFNRSNSKLSNNNIKHFTFDGKENIWIGTYHGLNYFDKAKKTFEVFLNDPNSQNSLIHDQVHAVFVDVDGLVWIGTNGGGVQTYDPIEKKFTLIPTLYNNIYTIYGDSRGRIWVGSNTGIECFDRISKKPLEISSLAEPSENPRNVFVNAITEDSEGRIILSTQNHGFGIIENDQITWVNKRNGFHTNNINAIQEDDNGALWVSTNTGLTKVIIDNRNPDSLAFHIENYYKTHGLQSNQFYPNCSMKGKDGKLYFGGVNGYNHFYPSEIVKIEYQPKVIFSQVKVIGENTEFNPFRESTHTPIILNYSQRNIRIDFTGLSYVNPEELIYRYRLNNNDSTWQNLGNQRSINMAYLPIGKHELSLQSSSSPNEWDSTSAVLKINVLPPFWRTWWAYLGYLIFFLVILYIYSNLSLKWAKLKSSLLMEQFQKEKEKELHESKLKFFTDISHELRTPLTLILAPIENILNQSDLSGRFKNQIQMIHKNGNRMFTLINQLLDLRKLETGNDQLKVAKGDFIKFIKEICLAFDAISEINQIKLNISAQEESHYLWFDRDKMEIVFYNLLSNAFKYTPKNGSITLDIRSLDKDQMPNEIQKKGIKGGLQLVITDSGQGIPEEEIRNIFQRYYSTRDESNKNPTGIGLELAKRMIDLHHGQIDVSSKVQTNENSGFTSFIIFLADGNELFQPHEIIENFKSSEDVSQYTYDFIQREKELYAENFKTDRSELIFNKQKKTLLVVEDNPEVRQFIISLLQAEYNVIEAENGKLGLEKTLKEGPDLIICDIMMPEMTGIEMCREIKKDSRISHTPVILLTARTAITFKFEGFETGADEYITKPFSGSYLLLRIQNLLQQRETLQRHFKTEKILEPADLSITSVDEKLLKKAIDYINNNISKTDITVNELSRELGLSRVHFYRKMKALTNMTAIEFIRNVRLRRACQLLEQGKFNIKEVKNHVGFENADYFRKCFKEAYNMTPSEYAEKHISSNK